MSTVSLESMMKEISTNENVITHRPASLDDISILLKYEKDYTAFEKNGAHTKVKKYIKSGPIPKTLEEKTKYVSNKYIVEYNGSICGTFTFRTMSPAGDMFGRISTIYVIEEYRAKGIGKYIMKAAESLAVESGCVLMALAVRENNEVAKQLYISSGFEQSSIELVKLLK